MRVKALFALLTESLFEVGTNDVGGVFFIRIIAFEFIDISIK
jgi:hypothetical protein